MLPAPIAAEALPAPATASAQIEEAANPPTHRALVLGAGGPTGGAWEIGVIRGLRDEGVDLRDADLIVGTSTGAEQGLMIATGQDIDDLIATSLIGQTDRFRWLRSTSSTVRSTSLIERLACRSNAPSPRVRRFPAPTCPSQLETDGTWTASCAASTSSPLPAMMRSSSSTLPSARPLVRTSTR
ncbi:MAG TPA: patatin-like phospholipase family protein [Chloroflexota bacterium]|nr:patatin-like phospholipase family protein [Chloroflexota bacterium]